MPIHDLDKSMRALAEQPTMANRFSVYRALLDAMLVVPLTAERDDDSRPPELADLARTEDDDAQVVIFTDDVGLCRWRQGGGARWTVRGRTLFPMLAAARCKGLQINPGGSVGGALYGHEIGTLADAVPRLPPLPVA